MNQMDKILLFLKKYGLYILLFLVLLLVIMVVPTLLINKKPVEEVFKIVDKTKKEIQKTETQIEIKKVEMEIKNKVADDKKENLVKQLEIIKTIEDQPRKRQKVIELHEKIKKFN